MELLQFGLVLDSIVVICSVSTVFAKEVQTKMLPLIFATEEGRRKAVYAKVLAAFLLTASAFIGIVLCISLFTGIICTAAGFSKYKMKEA